jgi:hypothetical protein
MRPRLSVLTAWNIFVSLAGMRFILEEKEAVMSFDLYMISTGSE